MPADKYENVPTHLHEAVVDAVRRFRYGDDEAEVRKHLVAAHGLDGLDSALALEMGGLIFEEHFGRTDLA